MAGREDLGAKQTTPSWGFFVLEIRLQITSDCFRFLNKQKKPRPKPRLI